MSSSGSDDDGNFSDRSSGDSSGSHEGPRPLRDTDEVLQRHATLASFRRIGSGQFHDSGRFQGSQGDDAFPGSGTKSHDGVSMISGTPISELSRFASKRSATQKSSRRKALDWIKSNSSTWQRHLLRNPWCLPVSAMHLAASIVQRGWRTSWLSIAKPSTAALESQRPKGTYELIKEVAAAKVATATKKKRPDGDAHANTSAATALRQRYFDLMQRRMSDSFMVSRKASIRVYPTLKDFCAAIIQCKWRSVRRIKIVRIVRVYSMYKLYQVAAYEIQQAWKRYCNFRFGTGASAHMFKFANKLRGQTVAAKRIQKVWRKYSGYAAYVTLRNTIRSFNGIGDPSLMLKSVMPREWMLLDPAMQVHVRFRLGGSVFPPSIYYKIFTHGRVCDLGAFAPRDYAAERAGGQKYWSGTWYERVEQNGWRSLVTRLEPGHDRRKDEVERNSCNKVIRNFHYSRLRRRQDAEQIRRQRAIEWKRKMYGLTESNVAENDAFAVDGEYPLTAFAAGAPLAPGGIARVPASQASSGYTQDDEPKPAHEFSVQPEKPAGLRPPGRSPRPVPSIQSSACTSRPGSALTSTPGGQSRYYARYVNLADAASTGSQEIEQPDEDLVNWSLNLDFEAYMDFWTCAAISDMSEGTLPIATHKCDKFAVGRVY